MALQIKVTNDPGRLHSATIALDGSLDAATSGDLEKIVDELLASPVRVIAFDLAKLKFISSAGIRVLMKVRQGLTGRGGSCALTNLQPQVAKVFEIVKALPGVSVFSNEAEMDEYLAAMQRKVIEEG